MISNSDDNGRSWSTPETAFGAISGTVIEGRDTRDPRLAVMPSGHVVLTFFMPELQGQPGSGGLWYAVKQPLDRRFGTAVQLHAGMASHGSALPIAEKPGAPQNQVLIPAYSGGDSSAGGAWYIRATWQEDQMRLQVTDVRKIMNNWNPPGRRYSEPHLVQVADTVIGVVRAEQNGNGSPAIVVKWDPYLATPNYSYQSLPSVIASSHHLLVTSCGNVLFTYGDRGATDRRPTVGLLIERPLETWVPGSALSIYDSGIGAAPGALGDQANPASVEGASTTFLTLGFNAKDKVSDPQNGGSLWVIETTRPDYQPDEGCSVGG
ncbi:MAG: exo-alpha-sialidase [Actinomycetota bacterium]